MIQINVTLNKVKRAGEDVKAEMIDNNIPFLSFSSGLKASSVRKILWHDRNDVNLFDWDWDKRLNKQKFILNCGIPSTNQPT